jgi:monofunctional chorismate mutase
MKRRVQARPTIAAVRGAISVPADTPRDIRHATARLLRALLEANRLTPDRIVSAVFTTTPDLESDYPAHAARELGWHDVPLLGAREIRPPGSLARVVRVLLTVRDPGALRLEPVYLDEAAKLRPDLSRAVKRAGPRGPARRVAIIGLGQIGGSIGLALTGSGWTRRGFDRSRATRRQAKAAGALDRACASLSEACAGAELAVVAVPMDVMAETIERVAGALPKGAALLDTGSARAVLAPTLSRAAQRGLHVVGGHPLAGNQGRGFASARADLLRGATFCLEPFVGTKPPPIVRELLRLLGARPLVVRASKHDRALARTSHLPYLVARSVHALGRGAAKDGLAGPTFGDFTRVAASDPRMAEAYVRANRAEVVRAWSELRARLERTIARLDRGPAPRRTPRRGRPGR